MAVIPLLRRPLLSLLLLLPLAFASEPPFLRGNTARATPTSRSDTDGLGFAALRAFPTPTVSGSDLLLDVTDLTVTNETFLAGTIVLFTFTMNLPLNYSGGLVLLPLTTMGYSESTACQAPSSGQHVNGTCLSDMLDVYATDPLFFFAPPVEYLPPLAGKRVRYVALLPIDTEGLHLLASNVSPDTPLTLTDTSITFLEPGAADQAPLLDTDEPTTLSSAVVAPPPPTPAGNSTSTP